jgi:hypothetical protein
VRPMDDKQNLPGELRPEFRRILRTIFQSQADLADRCFDGTVRIHKDVLAPNAIKDFLPGHQLATTFNQQKEQGNALEPDHAARSAQLEDSPVELDSNRKI